MLSPPVKLSKKKWHSSDKNGKLDETKKIYGCLSNGYCDGKRNLYGFAALLHAASSYWKIQIHIDIANTLALQYIFSRAGLSK